VNRRDIHARPWYREPWPWLLMAGPAVVMVAGFATLFLALRSDDGLVVDDYYRQGLAINATLAREERARSLGIKASFQISTQRNSVQIRLNGISKGPARLRLRLVHPTRMGQDRSVVLNPLPGGAYGAEIGLLEQGAWRVLLEDDVSGWRIIGTLPSGQSGTDLGPGPER
jgi:hypothetical protein